MQIYLMKVKVQLVHWLARFIYYKHLPHNNIIAALMGNYCGRKRLAISLTMCKQKKYVSKTALVRQKIHKYCKCHLLCQKIFQIVADAPFVVQKK